jgi:hypothetical protein
MIRTPSRRYPTIIAAMIAYTQFCVVSHVMNPTTNAPAIARGKLEVCSKLEAGRGILSRADAIVFRSWTTLIQ